MKTVIHSLLVLLLIPLFNPITVETSLNQLIQFAQEHQYQIESGQLIIKEAFSTTEQDHIEKQLIELGFEKSNHRFDRKLAPDLIETVTIIDTQDQRGITVNYQLTGNISLWSEDKDYANRTNRLIATIYTSKRHDYACIKLSIHDMMLSGYFFENIKKEWNYQEIDRIEEPDLTVMSGYSPKFKQKIPYKNQLMNLQISVRTGINQEKQVMIGTPILMTEY